MLNEIHMWFVDNLRDRAPTSGSSQIPRVLAPDSASAITRFEIFAESPDGPTLLCGNASLHSAWNKKSSGSDSNQLFQCYCPTQATELGLHASILEAVGRKLIHPQCF
jgi:hypothetical protein